MKTNAQPEMFEAAVDPRQKGEPPYCADCPSKRPKSVGAYGPDGLWRCTVHDEKAWHAHIKEEGGMTLVRAANRKLDARAERLKPTHKAGREARAEFKAKALARKNVRMARFVRSGENPHHAEVTDQEIEDAKRR